jgi:type II secretion system (T2SS) protein K
MNGPTDSAKNYSVRNARYHVMRLLAYCFTIISPILSWAEAPLAHVVFLEPVGHVDASGAEIRDVMLLYRAATNQEKYAVRMKNESAERALRLYRQASELAGGADALPDYYVALVTGGNHAAVGLRLQTPEGTNDLPRQPYILLDPEPWRFETTLLHETGHMIMALLAGGRQLDGDELASIPHSTAALSDRTTAFSEGWAIHLETMAAHLARAPELRHRYHREIISFGDGPWRESEYFRHSVDLTSYSQNVARYAEIRDNNFAFESAMQTPDYLRVQLEKARDFSSLRDANQLLQSEGFYASFFFAWLVRGNETPTEAVLTDRYGRVLRAMKSMFGAVKAEPGTPWLAHFVVEYMKLFPDEKTALVDALNDLSHGVFVDASARARWREHYLGALRLDRSKLNIEGISTVRKHWREQVLADPGILFSRLGPQLRCTVPACPVTLAALGEDSPLRFDVNTAPPGILRLIPGITEEEANRWSAERDRKPFQGVADFRTRVHLSPESGSKLQF